MSGRNQNEIPQTINMIYIIYALHVAEMNSKLPYIISHCSR